MPRAKAVKGPPEDKALKASGCAHCGGELQAHPDGRKHCGTCGCCWDPDGTLRPPGCTN
ncbi:MAG TPA: hypothetical protein VNN07_06500 [Candidatus Tectomicrobia bacterium]|nr:hypothetical protein [Candidatus Tectomicrobia bacterium]